MLAFKAFIFVFLKACRKTSSSVLLSAVWEAGEEAGLSANHSPSHSLQCNPHKSYQEKLFQLFEQTELLTAAVLAGETPSVPTLLLEFLPEQRIRLQLENKRVIAVTLKRKKEVSFII